MLCNCPTRAHRPIVPGVNLTFEDASKSAASDSDIQSEGAFDIGQSVSFDWPPDDASPDDEADAPDDEAGSVDLAPSPVDLEFEPSPPEAAAAPSPESELEPRDALPGRDEERSLRAQPVPL